MSGIPVYTQSPVNAAKASGVTPQTATASGQQPFTSAPNTAPTTTTATASSVTSYPAAQPGAMAPQPTGASQRYAPVVPTPTTRTEDNGPPAPQPGAFPTPSKTNLPPPPKAGETYHPPPPTAAPQSFPPQMGILPPTRALGAQPPASSTSTTNQPSSSYPVPISSAEFGGPRRSIEHPPGYQQNTYAADLNPDQRRAHEAETSRTFDNRTSQDGEQESMWVTAKNWAQQAGTKLQAVEEDVWKKINKQ